MLSELTFVTCDRCDTELALLSPGATNLCAGHAHDVRIRATELMTPYELDDLAAYEMQVNMLDMP